MIIRDKYGYPIERVRGRPIRNLIRTLIHMNVLRTWRQRHDTVGVRQHPVEGVEQGPSEKKTANDNRYYDYRDLLERWAAWWNGPGRHHYTYSVIPPITDTGKALNCTACHGISGMDEAGQRCQVCGREIQEQW